MTKGRVLLTTKNLERKSVPATYSPSTSREKERHTSGALDRERPTHEAFSPGSRIRTRAFQDRRRDSKGGQRIPLEVRPHKTPCSCGRETAHGTRRSLALQWYCIDVASYAYRGRYVGRRDACICLFFPRPAKGLQRGPENPSEVATLLTPCLCSRGKAPGTG